MKKVYHSLFALAVAAAICLLSSCASTFSMFNTPNYKAAEEAHAADVSSYADHVVENCKLPDGKTMTVYVFNNIYDQMKWQNVQSRKFNPKWQQMAKERIASLESLGGRTADNLIPYWKWMPTGPLSPFWKATASLVDKYGENAALEISKNLLSPISYYKAEDLGQLAAFMTTLDSAAQACYEDSKGVYIVTICRPNYLKKGAVSKQMQKLHKDEFAYEVGFIPKEMYKVQPVKLTPAKTQPFNPSDVPDSDRNLAPSIPTGNSAYYYDENLAYRLQWLAVKIACKGVYDMAYTGNFKATNPHDYYKTSFIKSYLASNDGRTSKGTTLFEGICFDYADFAYQELTDNKKEYPNVANFWMVGTFDDGSDIVAYRLAKAGESSTMTINRTPVVVFSHNHILAHLQGNGRPATGHAWFWVQSTDGTVYWVDPTWTDNSGRPVYGIVRGGKEVELPPSSDLCVN